MAYCGIPVCGRGHIPYQGILPYYHLALLVFQYAIALHGKLMGYYLQNLRIGHYPNIETY